MLPILPWLPATELVFGMDIRLCQAARDKTIEKTQAAAAALRKGDKPRPWGPLNIIFKAGEQKVKFDSNVTVSQTDKGILLSVNNHMQLVEGKNIQFTLTEIMRVNFPNPDSEIQTVGTIAESFGQVFTDLPLSVIAALPGHKLGQIISFPDEIHGGLENIMIEAAAGRHMTLRTTEISNISRDLHNRFYQSINSPE